MRWSLSASFGWSEVVAEMASREDGDQVGGRHARGGVARARFRAATDAVDANLLSDFAHEVEGGE